MVGVDSSDDSSDEDRPARATETHAGTVREVYPIRSDSSAHSTDRTAEPSTAST
jgi:hypothetical protein